MPGDSHRAQSLEKIVVGVAIVVALQACEPGQGRQAERSPPTEPVLCCRPTALVDARGAFPVFPFPFFDACAEALVSGTGALSGDQELRGEDRVRLDVEACLWVDTVSSSIAAHDGSSLAPARGEVKPAQR